MYTTCQKCKIDFTITSDDQNFYKKINVPPPTFCPDCRLQRRLSWRNDWHLFRKKEARNGQEIFSIFPEESPIKIYDKEYWNSDEWDPTSYGKDFDFTRPFFEQFKELLYAVPLPAHSLLNIVNSPYCSNANDIKNCYLVRGASFTEDSSYLIWDQASKQCFDSHMTNTCELGYGNVNTVKCYQTFFSVDCESSSHLILCKDCVGSNNCFGSIGLRNKSYYIFNEPYTKEQYENKITEFNLGSEKSFVELKEKAYKNWLTFPQKYMHSRQNVVATGDYIYESKNALDCYRVRGVENGKFIQNVLIGPAKDCYDYSNYGDNVELIYESLVIGSGASNIKFSTEAYPNTSDLTYCIYCNKSSNLFGCVSLRSKKYCILNKQYTKEAYEELLPKIIEHMKKTGEYGEFFPSDFSPLPYLATAAYEFFPLNENEAKQKGFVWYTTKNQEYAITLLNKDIPDNIKEVGKDILKEVIECQHQGNCKQECVGAFKIIESEFDFCQRMNIPLPRLCPNCRHYEQLELRNPIKLYKRECMNSCGNTFETTYAPDRPEIVYCESCYNQEVV